MLHRDGAGNLVDALAFEIEAALDSGIVVVAAAGNTDSEVSDPYFVHCIDGVISVGGVNGTRPWSGVGEAQGVWNDLWALGGFVSTGNGCLRTGAVRQR